MFRRVLRAPIWAALVSGAIFGAILFTALDGQGVFAKDVRQWSTTAASNNDASPDGWPENMAPSGVNDSARENMAAIAELYATQYGRNALINGDFRVAQRGTSFTGATTPANSDDTYLLDRWILLSDSNDIVDVTQSTDAPTNGLNSIALDVETVDKKFGI